MSKWYSGQGSNSDVVMSSKIRLARNLQKTPFPCQINASLQKFSKRYIRFILAKTN